MERVWIWLWWWVSDPTQFMMAFTWVALVIGVLEVERRRRKLNLPPPLAEPACPACGYLVIGLAGKVCPECGADLASVGVVRRDDHRTSPLARVTLWTILFALPAFLVWREVRPRLPVLSEYTVTQTFSGPLSGAYRSIEVRSRQHSWQWWNQPRSIAPYERLEFRLQRLDSSQPVYRMTRQPVAAEKRSAYLNQFLTAQKQRDYPTIFDRRPLLEWMRTQGVDTDDIAVQAEVDTIGVLLDQRSLGIWRAAATSPFGNMPIVQTAYRGRPWWLHAACAAVALVIWLIGVRRFAKRRTLPYERTALPARTA